MHEKRTHLAANPFFMVRHLGKFLHEIDDEIDRWREILTVPYMQYKLSR